MYQGPLFDEKIDRWADDVQIPSSFWKVVVSEGATKLKAVGLVVDQLALLDETRASLRRPEDLPAVDVQPVVGAEAARRITRLEDIQL